MFENNKLLLIELHQCLVHAGYVKSVDDKSFLIFFPSYTIHDITVDITVIQIHAGHAGVSLHITKRSKRNLATRKQQSDI